MWWHEPPRTTVSRLARLVAAFALAGLLGGCFEPLYGQKTLSGGPGLQQRLSAVGVDPIVAPSGTPVARIAVELQNDLIYNFTGGAGQTGRSHQLKVNIGVQNQQVIVDINTARPDVQQFGINASYTLTELATGKSVVTGTTSARVSYDNPGQQQRFANARGQRDAENRAAKVIADNIKARLASYFAAGT
jgi:LPS-assembly lipoprotein